jgi:hypothetical protein
MEVCMTESQPLPSRPARSVSVPVLLGLVLLAGAFACQDQPRGCLFHGVQYQTGESFKNSCNSCSCGADGQVACTLVGCGPPEPVDAGAPPDGAQDVGDTGGQPDQRGDGPTCDFATSYDYGYIGGFRISVDRSYLSPGNQYRHTRVPISTAGPALLSCAPPLPACGASDVITSYDVEVHDLPLADVQAALAMATPPLYGFDMRPSDGTVFEFRRADGRGFLVGSPCTGATTPCTAVPAGVAQLKQRLLDLDAQQLAQPECAALRGP